MRHRNSSAHRQVSFTSLYGSPFSCYDGGPFNLFVGEQSWEQRCVRGVVWRSPLMISICTTGRLTDIWERAGIARMIARDNGITETKKPLIEQESIIRKNIPSGVKPTVESLRSDGVVTLSRNHVNGAVQKRPMPIIPITPNPTRLSGYVGNAINWNISNPLSSRQRVRRYFNEVH